jgi:hypothetical protein
LPQYRHARGGSNESARRLRCTVLRYPASLYSTRGRTYILMARPGLQAVLPLRPLVSQAYWCRPNVAGPSRLRSIDRTSRRYAQASLKSVDGSDAAPNEGEAIPLAPPSTYATSSASSGQTSPIGSSDPIRGFESQHNGARSTSEPFTGPSTSKRDSSLDDRLATLKARASEAYKQANTSASAWSAETRRQAQQRFEQLKSEIGQLSWRINEATGYEEIDRLKALVTERGTSIHHPTAIYDI